jgi:biopolymer transport protein ExbB
MKTLPFRAGYGAIAAIALLSFVSPLTAQNAAPAPAQPPALSQPVFQTPVAPTMQAPPSAAQTPAAVTPSAPMSLAPDAAATDTGNKSLRAGAATFRELSPWSMFLSADVLVKAVMIGLAFASLVTWTIFIAKLIELSFAQRRLRGALNQIGEARSLAEAQFALGPKKSVLASLLAAAMREARMSAGISSDSGIKERAASSFGEIVRA